MRRVLAQYCASHIRSYRKNDVSNSTLGRFATFREDLLAALVPGEKVKAVMII